MVKIYAGVGSRNIPVDMFYFMEDAAATLARKGYVLRSGGAEGADTAFETGCDRIDPSKKEIYLPWKGFNGNLSERFRPSDRAMRIAEEFHPLGVRMSYAVSKLMARNSHQILGEDCESPCDFVVCWTKNGALIGGTSQAIRLAQYYGIKVYNLGNSEDKQEFGEFLKSL